jgi:hypothetical protein
MASRAFDGVHMSYSTLMKQTDRVVDSLVLVTVRIQMRVLYPGITHDRSAGFDQSANKSQTPCCNEVTVDLLRTASPCWGR